VGANLEALEYSGYHEDSNFHHLKSFVCTPLRKSFTSRLKFDHRPIIRAFTLILVLSMVAPINMGLIFAEPQIQSATLEQQQIIQKLEKSMSSQTLIKHDNSLSKQTDLALSSIDEKKIAASSLHPVSYTHLTLPTICSV